MRLDVTIGDDGSPIEELEQATAPIFLEQHDQSFAVEATESSFPTS